MLNSCDAFGQLATNTIHWTRLDAILLPCYTLRVYANFVNYLRHWLPGKGKAGGRQKEVGLCCGSTTSADAGKTFALVAQSQFVRDQSETNKIFQLSIQQFAREKCSNGRAD